MRSPLRALVSEYKKRKAEIRGRLKDFAVIHKASHKDIFSELCFCILTANANALQCARAITELNKTGLLFCGSCGRIKPKLKGRVRFHNKKARYIVGARKIFCHGRSIDMKALLSIKNAFEMREWLVRNVKGLGYKEASHFLRNIGLGRDIAILDRHILKNLKNYGVIGRIPPSLGSRKVYLSVEERMRRFSRAVRIPIDELDLLFWSMETGFVFK